MTPSGGASSFSRIHCRRPARTHEPRSRSQTPLRSAWTLPCATSHQLNNGSKDGRIEIDIGGRARADCEIDEGALAYLDGDGVFDAPVVAWSANVSRENLEAVDQNPDRCPVALRARRHDLSGDANRAVEIALPTPHGPDRPPVGDRGVPGIALDANRPEAGVVPALPRIAVDQRQALKVVVRVGASRAGTVALAPAVAVVVSVMPAVYALHGAETLL
jgi:hypothetical protein